MNTPWRTPWLRGIALGLAAGVLCAGACAQSQPQDDSTAQSHSAKAKHDKAAKSSTSAKSTGSQTIQPYTAKPIQEYHATPVRPNDDSGTRPAPHPQPNRAGRSLIGTFGLAVPGVAYSYDNYATSTRTTVTSTGVVTKSAVRINPNHTYDWNSAWDGRMIHGNWVEKDGGVLLLHGQEGKNWLLRTMDRPSGNATVTLWDQDSMWYNGTPLR